MNSSYRMKNKNPGRPSIRGAHCTSRWHSCTCMYTSPFCCLCSLSDLQHRSTPACLPLLQLYLIRRSPALRGIRTLLKGGIQAPFMFVVVHTSPSSTGYTTRMLRDHKEDCYVACCMSWLSYLAIAVSTLCLLYR